MYRKYIYCDIRSNFSLSLIYTIYNIQLMSIKNVKFYIFFHIQMLQMLSRTHTHTHFILKKMNYLVQILFSCIHYTERIYALFSAIHFSRKLIRKNNCFSRASPD